MTAFRRHREEASPRECSLAIRPVGVADDARVFVIIQSGAAQMLVAQVKAQRLYQVQIAAGIGAEANDVACVGRDFGLKEDDGKHGGRDSLRTRGGLNHVSRLEGTRDDRDVNFLGTMKAQYSGSFTGGGAAGHDIVDQQDPPSSQIVITGKRPAEIAVPELELQARLRGGGQDAL